jgi:hypothetical protein
MIRILAATFVLCGLSSPLAAQKTATWGAVGRTVHYEYRLMNPTSEVVRGIDVYLPLPHESPRQEIHYRHLSERGRERVFTDVHGQRIVHYSFERLKPGEWVDVGFLAGATLRNLRWIEPQEPIAPGGPVLTAEERARYLGSLPNYSMESVIIRQTAEELTKGAGSEYEKLVRIHDHVIRSIRYVRDNDWDPAAVVLERGTGSCSEYNYVLSGLCRVAGLPTRYVGGSTNGFRPLPTTDTVYHRWTEVFLRGVGWFPVDCSRDANPIRGRRSHFGRVHTDMLVWCRQAGGGESYLRWDYRAEYRLQGRDPGLKDTHRTRWLPFQPEDAVVAAGRWLSSGQGPRPVGDLLEAALLRWPEASEGRQVEMVEALAEAGRSICLRRAATLPEAGDLRAERVRSLVSSEALADEILERSRQIDRLCSWFRSNESRLVPTGGGRFRLERPAPEAPAAAHGASDSEEVWKGLVRKAVQQLERHLSHAEGKSVTVMPVVSHTGACLEASPAGVHDELERLVAAELGLHPIDEHRFNDFLEAKGPGRGEFWAFALAEEGRPGARLPESIRPEYILVPICITEKTPDGCRHQLDVKGLELSGPRTFSVRTRGSPR